MQIQSFLEKNKQLKRKMFFLKAKLFLFFVLPVIIILLAVKVMETFLQIKLRSVGSKFLREEEEHKGSTSSRQQVSQSSFKPQVVTPEFVGEPLR